MPARVDVLKRGAGHCTANWQGYAETALGVDPEAFTGVDGAQKVIAFAACVGLAAVAQAGGVERPCWIADAGAAALA